MSSETKIIAPTSAASISQHSLGVDGALGQQHWDVGVLLVFVTDFTAGDTEAVII